MSFGVINTISFVTPPREMPLIIEKADAGASLQTKVNLEQALTYSSTIGGRQIIAFLDKPTPKDTILTVEVLDPLGISTGVQTLTNYPVTVISSIPEGECASAPVRYTWQAKITSGPMNPTVYTVTYAIIGE